MRPKRRLTSANNWQSEINSTPVRGSFDSGCQSSDDFIHKLSRDASQRSGLERHDSQEDDPKNNSDDSQVVVNIPDKQNLTGPFDVDHLENKIEEKVGSMYQVRLPHYSSAIDLHNLKQETEDEVEDAPILIDHYESLDPPLENGSLQDCNESETNTSNSVQCSQDIYPGPSDLSDDTIDNKNSILNAPPPNLDFSVTFDRMPDTPRPYRHLHVCSICDQRFTSRGELTHHHNHTHEQPEKQEPAEYDIQALVDAMGGGVLDRYQCPLCKIVLKTRDSFQGHMNSQHNRNKSYRCNFCGKTYFSRQSVYAHKVRYHRYSAAGNTVSRLSK